MSKCAVAAVAVALCLDMMALKGSVAQTFEERWSPIPKAHAEPLQHPPPTSESGPQSTPQKSEHRNAGVPAHRRHAASSRPHKGGTFTGRASFYSYRSGKTARGDTFNRNRLTAAHRTLPFGTRLRVTDVETGKSVQVVVTDRGPAQKRRVLDLSLGAAKVLDMGKRGVIEVRAEVVGRE